MKEIIGIVAVLLGILAYAPYIRDIMAKKTHPHPFSWFIWGLVAICIYMLQASHGAGAGAYLTATAGFFCFTVCALALKNGGHRDITRTDTAMLFAALAAMGVWVLADQSELSMILLLLADMFGFVPSIRKAWRKPYGETPSLWGINSLRHALSIPALAQLSLVTVLNPLVWTIANGGFFLMLLYRRKLVKPPRGHASKRRPRRRKLVPSWQLAFKAK